MDPIIKQTIESMLSTFSHFQVSDDALLAEIEEYRKEMRALGEGVSDIGAFMTSYQSSGLMERQTDLITRATMAAHAPAAGQEDTAGGAAAPNDAPAALPSVTDFLSQYRGAYDAAKNHGFQFTTVKAYEQLFALSERFTDLMPLHLALEEEGHLHSLTACAMYDVNKLHFDMTDPNNLGVREQFHALMALAGSYKTDEELHYQTDLLVQQNQQGMYRHNFKVVLATQLALACTAYAIAKSGARFDLAKTAGIFIAAREGVRNTYTALVELFGLDYDAMLADPWLRHWLLNPKAIESTSRVSQCLDTRNLEFFREVIFEEVFSELTDLQCLERKPRQAFLPSLNVEHDPEQRQAEEAILEAGKQRLKDKYYYQNDQ